MTIILEKHGKAHTLNDVSLYRNAHAGLKAQAKSVVNQVVFGIMSTVLLMAVVSIATREIVYTVAPQVVDEITTKAVRSLLSN